MNRATCAIALCLAAGAASADCPTTLADAAMGVYVSFDGIVVRYGRQPDGTVEEVEFDTADATGLRYLSHHGILILESAELAYGILQPDTEEVITYDTPLPPQFSPGMTYSAMTTVQYANDAPFQEALSITVGTQAQEQIGECSMATLPIEMRTGPANDQYVSNFTYFPALGFGVYVGGFGPGEAPGFYPPTYIGTEPPSAPSAFAPVPSAPATPAPAAPASK